MREQDNIAESLIESSICQSHRVDDTALKRYNDKSLRIARCAKKMTTIASHRHIYEMQNYFKRFHMQNGVDQDFRVKESIFAFINFS